MEAATDRELAERDCYIIQGTQSFIWFRTGSRTAIS